jgi:hypothetical protein
MSSLNSLDELREWCDRSGAVLSYGAMTHGDDVTYYTMEVYYKSDRVYFEKVPFVDNTDNFIDTTEFAAEKCLQQAVEKWGSPDDNIDNCELESVETKSEKISTYSKKPLILIGIVLFCLGVLQYRY